MGHHVPASRNEVEVKTCRENRWKTPLLDIAITAGVLAAEAIKLFK
jgi:hypothetical protein